MSDVIYLGVDKATGNPVAVPRAFIQSGHTVIRGMTGSGKTSKIIIPTVTQLMQSYQDESGWPRNDALVIIDLGGDQNAFHRVKHAADELGRRFRFFSLSNSDQTAHFPALQFLRDSDPDRLFVANQLVNSFHLDFGLVYGAAYFAQQNLAALHDVAGVMIANEHEPTLQDVCQYMNTPESRRQFKDADQVRMIFQFLAEYEQLGFAPADDPDNEILLSRAIEDSEVIYFFLPSLQHSTMARLVAGMALFTTVNAQIRRHDENANRRHVYVVADEFQEIVGSALSRMLAQTRKYDTTLVLAHQTTQQLENRDASLADVVFEGTNMKVYFTSVGQRDTEQLQSLSKDKERKLRSKAATPFSSSERVDIVPMLERDTILDVTCTANDAFLIVNDGRGHHEPLVITTAHDVPKSVYLQLSNKPLPKRDDLTSQRRMTAGQLRNMERQRERSDRIDELVRKLNHERLWRNE